MAVNTASSIRSVALRPPSQPAAALRAGGTRSFAEVLKDAIQEVNALQVEAEQAARDLASGQVEDVHKVTLAVEQAQLALELTVAVRNKLIEAYQEISRMQI